MPDHERGTVYVDSVSGPKFYPINPRHKRLMARMGPEQQLYQVITVDDATLRYESWTVAGELFDSFELKKGVTGSGATADSSG